MNSVAALSSSPLVGRRNPETIEPPDTSCGGTQQVEILGQIERGSSRSRSLILVCASTVALPALLLYLFVTSLASEYRERLLRIEADYRLEQDDLSRANLKNGVVRPERVIGIPTRSRLTEARDLEPAVMPTSAPMGESAPDILPASPLLHSWLGLSNRNEAEAGKQAGSLPPAQVADEPLSDSLRKDVHDFSQRLEFLSWTTMGFALLGFALLAGLFVWHSQLDRQRDARLRALTLLKERAEEASRTKTVFLSKVSHELRTPLSGILGFSELLVNDGTDPSKVRLFASLILRSGQTLLNLIQDLLDLSKIENGKISIETGAAPLAEFAQEVVDRFKPLAQKKNLGFCMSLDTELPTTVYLDKGKLNQILDNLIGNAIKFTAKGQIDISLKSVPGSNNPTLLITIADSGRGIRSQDRSSLFEPFSASHRPGTDGEKGSGLGLAITRGLVEAMGGSISLISNEGKGTTFTVAIPYQLSVSTGEIKEPVDTHEIPVTHPSPFSGFAPAVADGRPKLLLVEDNETNQVMIQELLARLGHGCDVAQNGIEALDLFRANKYDLIFMDCQLPDVDGKDVARRIRESGSEVRIVALTASAYAQDRADCLSAGMNDFVSKPVSMGTLEDALAPVLSRSRSASAIDKLRREIGDQGFAKVALAFIESTRSSEQTLTAALEVGDSESVRKAAHKLKSSVRLFGAESLGRICEGLERIPAPEEASVLARSLTQGLRGLRVDVEKSLPS